MKKQAKNMIDPEYAYWLLESFLWLDTLKLEERTAMFNAILAQDEYVLGEWRWAE